MSAFQLTNLTRQVEIGANCYLLEAAGKRIVLDCGAHPKFEGLDTLPLLALLKGRPLDAIVLSHAHQDHLGSLPVLMRQHPETPVYLTEPTLQLADVMLHNSVNVMLKRKEAGQSDYPLFTHKEVTACVRRFRSVPLHVAFTLDGERLRPNAPLGPDEVSLQFFDAGHILGSASILFRCGGESLLYSGDVNFQDQSLMQGARLPEQNIDTLILESTRGATPEPPGFSREAEVLRFAAAIREVFAQGGSVLIPVFALGKTQELLTMIHGLRRKGLLPECPLYIGGLGTKLTEIHDRLASASHRQHPGLDLLDSVAPFTLSGREVNQFPIRPGRIYALSSGMMTENTLSNVIASQFLPNPGHGIFFVGYADPESPAGRLRCAPHGAPFMVSPTSEPEVLRCRVETFAFSAHGSRESLLGYLTKTAPKKIVLVHGDQPAVDSMSASAREALPDSQVLVPLPGIPLPL
ncbi:MAG: putative exonuclease of the beta-lactamase fold involved in processing [Verrucomicrobiota bacterium]|jgi:Cft2 family RNA processing exonuclease